MPKKWIIGLCSFSVLTAMVSYTSLVRLTKNFHEVDPGKFYRSAQLTPGELSDVIDRYGIRTVISLRGAPKNAYWYKSEFDTLAEKKIGFRVYWLTTDYFPEREELQGLLNDFKNAPKPILIHCRTGADRTGMVTALYEIEEMHQPKETALEMLSPRYWHFEIFHPAMKAFVRAFGGSEWAAKYNPCDFPEYITKDTKCSPK